jgi:hypothetical protein
MDTVGHFACDGAEDNHTRTFSCLPDAALGRGFHHGAGLLAELIPLGYIGSLTNLQRFLNPWRRAQFLAVAGLPAPHLAAPRDESPAHPAVPPIAAAALCIKPRGQLTEERAAKVDMLKATSGEFASMRGLAMRFRGILKGADPGKLDPWLDDALSSRIRSGRLRYASMNWMRFARTVQLTRA